MIFNTVLGGESHNMDWWYEKMVYGDVYEFSTAGSYNITAPSWGANVMIITATAGGGGGAGANGTNSSGYPGRGGKAGEYVEEKEFSFTAGQNIAVTVGTGGNGGTCSRRASNSVNGTAGGNGGDTVIGNLLTLAGGTGGALGDYSNRNESTNGADGLGAGGAVATTIDGGGNGDKGGGGGGGIVNINSTAAMEGYGKGGNGGGGYVKIAFKYKPTK